jgi:coenzyme A diphosphatase NUDT7
MDDLLKKMDASLRTHYTGGIIGENKALRAAVLIPLIKKEETYEVLFEVRAFHLKSQPGDICFPGGKIDPSDDSPLDAAIRETTEELGLGPSSIKPIGSLDRYVPSSQFIIHPFVGILETTDFKINKDEVDHTFTIPLNWLLSHEPVKHIVQMDPQPGEDFPYDKIAQGKAYNWRKRTIEELFYHYKDHSVWGMTARILTHFLKIIQLPPTSI